MFVIMSKPVLIPHAPSETYLALKARADAAGMSLPDYLDVEWEKTRPRFTKEELIERIRQRAHLFAGIDAAQLIREGREEREAQLDSLWDDVSRR